jgi:xanthine phosphoribosyltransferase
MNIPAIVAERGRVSGDLVLVDDFLNHRVDPIIIDEIGRQIAEHFADQAPDLIVTAEASGIPPAMATARHLPVPVVYAKKYLGVGDRYTFAREVVSPTKGVEYRVEVARRALEPGGRTLIVDDFLSGGRTAEALGQIVEESGGEVLGFAFVIEKQFAGGRTILESHGWDVWSVVEIAGIENGKPLIANL